MQILRQAAMQEFKFGSPERGRSIFENLLRNYPKRMDLWSVYIDQVGTDDFSRKDGAYHVPRMPGALNLTDPALHLLWRQRLHVSCCLECTQRLRVL